jgi:hypothetical protein
MIQRRMKLAGPQLANKTLAVELVTDVVINESCNQLDIILLATPIRNKKG